jgi:hypothetical protein
MRPGGGMRVLAGAFRRLACAPLAEGVCMLASPAGEGYTGPKVAAPGPGVAAWRRAEEQEG